MGVRRHAALNINQPCFQLLRQLARPSTADGKGKVRCADFADGGHHRRSAAGKGFDQSAGFRIRAPLVDRIRLFAHAQPFFSGKCDQAIARYAVQDRVGQRGSLNAAIVKDEEDVHSAQFLDPAMFFGVEEYYLIMTGLHGLGDWDKAGRVIATAFGSAGAAGTRTVIMFADPQRNGGCAAFEIIAGTALIVGWRIKLFSWLLLLLIVFFTFLTGYTYITGMPKNCGCFGDCLPISSKTSFLKDVALTIMIVFLFWKQKYIKPFLSNSFTTIKMIAVTIFAFGFQWYTLNYMPVVDCMPFKVGNNIPEKMKMPPNAIPDSTVITFVYDKNGQTVEFTATDFPADFKVPPY